MIKEIWKDIEGYEGLYQVSNYSRIKRFNKTKQSKPFKILKSYRDNDNRLTITLTKNNIGRQFRIYRLALENFIGSCPPEMECCHNDGNSENNFIENLRWDTRSANMKDSIEHGTHRLPDCRGSKHWGAILNEWKVRIIKRLIEDDYLTPKEICEIFNVTKYTVSDIKRNKSWKHVK